MADNKTLIIEEYEQLKGQLVLSYFEVYRLIGIVDDEEDYYWALYDGRKLHLSSCVGGVIPLKGRLAEKDYERLVMIAKLNHYDYMGMDHPNEEKRKHYEEFITEHKHHLTDWEETHSWMAPPHWGIV